jgi:hypothetical protein
MRLRSGRALETTQWSLVMAGGGDDSSASTVVSVPLVLEYEAVLEAHAKDLNLTVADADAIVDYLCQVSARHEVFFLWRPALRDRRVHSGTWCRIGMRFQLPSAARRADSRPGL